MKQKYTIFKDEITGGLKIQEHAELSKDLFSLICEESYDAEVIKTAMGENKTVLIDTLRTPNLYPVSEYIDKIADQVITLYDPSAATMETGPVELLFDDVELFRKEDTSGAIVNEKSVEIEDLLEEEEETPEELDPSETDPAEKSSHHVTKNIPVDTSDDESDDMDEDENL